MKMDERQIADAFFFSASSGNERNKTKVAINIQQQSKSTLLGTRMLSYQLDWKTLGIGNVKKDITA